MNESSPSSNPSPIRDYFIGELAWLSILYGVVLGIPYCLLMLKWLPARLGSLPVAILTIQMLAAAILGAAQLPIGIGILQRRRWAAIASYRTSLALAVLGLLALPLSLDAGKFYVGLTLLTLGWGFCAQSLIKSSDEIQELLHRKQ